MKSIGYSATPLAKKLGFRPGTRVWLINPPSAYRDWLGQDLPVDLVDSSPADMVHMFAASKNELEMSFRAVTALVTTDAVIWISWYKKAAKMATDITEDTIREIILPTGWVDVKVCAVSEEWSGLKVVKRLSERKKG